MIYKKQNIKIKETDYDIDKFTIKAQEAIQAAINLASRNGQQVIEPLHILAGIMEKGKDVVNYIFHKSGINLQIVESAVQSEISHLPKVSGGEPYLSPDANKSDTNNNG